MDIMPVYAQPMPQASRIAAALLVAGLGCFIEPASGRREDAAGSPEPIVVVYEVAVSGLTALKIRLDAEISGERYDVARVDRARGPRLDLFGLPHEDEVHPA